VKPEKKKYVIETMSSRIYENIYLYLLYILL